jgi:hypothetical protein
MTEIIVCDDCGKPIDQTQPYYELSGSLVQMEGEPPALTTVEPSKTMHYHQDHLAQNVLEPAQPPEEPAEESPVDPDAHPEHPIVEPDDPEEADEEEPNDPYPGVDISSMTIQQALAWADDDADKLQWAIDQEVAGQNRAALVNSLQNKLDRL